MLGQLRALADHVVDTTRIERARAAGHGDRAVRRPRAGRQAERDAAQLRVPQRHPAGERSGVRRALLPNPYFVEGLKPHPGTNTRVSQWVLERMQTQEFLSRLESMLLFLIPQYRAEGKSYLTVSIGCTGGRHRSVALAEELGRRLAQKHRANVNVTHRDVAKL